MYCVLGSLVVLSCSFFSLFLLYVFTHRAVVLVLCVPSNPVGLVFLCVVFCVYGLFCVC